MANSAPRYRIAINGYGRIGNACCGRSSSGDTPNLKWSLSMNSDLATITYLTRYDTTHGRFPGDVENDGQYLIIDGQRIQVLCEQDPRKLPWKALDVDLVLECSGALKIVPPPSCT